MVNLSNNISDVLVDELVTNKTCLFNLFNIKTLLDYGSGGSNWEKKDFHLNLGIQYYNNILISEDTILILDIDNTLIKPTTNLGSDQFFNWQVKEIKENGCQRITNSIPKLISIMIKLWNYIDYQLCEKGIDLLLSELKKKL